MSVVVFLGRGRVRSPPDAVVCNFGTHRQFTMGMFRALQQWRPIVPQLSLFLLYFATQVILAVPASDVCFCESHLRRAGLLGVGKRLVASAARC